MDNSSKSSGSVPPSYLTGSQSCPALSAPANGWIVTIKTEGGQQPQQQLSGEEVTEENKTSSSDTHKTQVQFGCDNGYHLTIKDSSFSEEDGQSQSKSQGTSFDSLDGKLIWYCESDIVGHNYWSPGGTVPRCIPMNEMLQVNSQIVVTISICTMMGCLIFLIFAFAFKAYLYRRDYVTSSHWSTVKLPSYEAVKKNPGQFPSTSSIATGGGNTTGFSSSLSQSVINVNFQKGVSFSEGIFIPSSPSSSYLWMNGDNLSPETTICDSRCARRSLTTLPLPSVYPYLSTSTEQCGLNHPSLTRQMRTGDLNSVCLEMTSGNHHCHQTPDCTNYSCHCYSPNICESNSATAMSMIISPGNEENEEARNEHNDVFDEITDEIQESGERTNSMGESLCSTSHGNDLHQQSFARGSNRRLRPDSHSRSSIYPLQKRMAEIDFQHPNIHSSCSTSKSKPKSTDFSCQFASDHSCQHLQQPPPPYCHTPPAFSSIEYRSYIQRILSKSNSSSCSSPELHNVIFNENQFNKHRSCGGFAAESGFKTAVSSSKEVAVSTLTTDFVLDE